MTHPFRSPTVYAALLALLLTGAISGFFYAWVCSTMWGLDATDPRVAMRAMQAMNESVRNPVFFPAFFLTPIALAATALLAWQDGIRRAATLMAAAAAVYFIGGFLLTVIANVPMNEALAATEIPSDAAEAARVWSDYSGRWQNYNLVRTAASFASLALAAVALVLIGRGRPAGRASQQRPTISE